jgi:predicted acetyltransferase
MIQLVRPTEAMKEQAIEFRQEFFEHGEFVINGSELFDKTDDYTEWCRTIDANTKEETVNPNWVITDTFFAVDDGRIVGIIEPQMNNGRNIDVKTKIDYYSRFSVCGENDSDTETFYFL